MNGLATRVVTLLSLFFFLAASGFSAESGLLTPEEVKTLMEEKIRRYLSDPTLQELAQVNGFYKDGLGLLRLYNVLGTPKLVNVQGKPVKYLIPIVFSETALAGFIHADPFTGDVLGWPNWDADGKPVYRVSRSEWEETQNASWSESIADIIPPNLLVSPGERVDPYSEKNWRFIDHGLDEMPFKNQEDRGEWIDQMNLQHQPRPRWTRFGTRWRQPALKCLAFAAATCGDWWTMEYARPLGSYTNVINGYREYGHNPRAVEAVFYVRHRLKPLKYFVVPFYPDPVTHEGIPFSLPGYCDVLTRPMRGTLPDPALPSAFSYEFGDNPYCMEKPAIGIFRFGHGRAKAVQDALQRHGIVYAQLNSGIPAIGFLSGVHAVAVVGWKDTASGPTFLYRESFGNFSSKYQEDMGGGPKYRAAPVSSFNQAYSFPHGLTAELLANTGTEARIRVVNGGGRSIDADLPGVQAFDTAARIAIPLRRGEGRGELILDLNSAPNADLVRLVLPRKYYYQGNGKPAETTLSLRHRKPALDPYDSALRNLVQDTLDKIEVFIGSLELRKSSYAFYSWFARLRIGNQMATVLRHRLALDTAWDTFADNPAPAARLRLVTMMRGAFRGYEKDLADYEAELTRKIAGEKDALKKKRLRVELAEVKGFILSLEQIEVRLEAIVKVMPSGRLDASMSRDPAPTSAPEAGTTSDPGSQPPDTGLSSPKKSNGPKKLTPKAAQALLAYQNTYAGYLDAINAGDKTRIQAALTTYREALDRYQAILNSGE